MSGAHSRRKGRTFQTAVRQWWDEENTVVEIGGAGLDASDLLVLFPGAHVAVEVKNCKAMDLAGWLDQAVRQAPDGTTPVVFHKRRGKADVGESYVTMRADDFRRLMR